MTDELLTVSEVAERLKMNQQTVRNWIDKGDLPATRVGSRRVRVSESELNRFLKLKDQASGPAKARVSPPRQRRRATVTDMRAVEEIIDGMLETASALPLGSLVARELAESAGRLQLAIRVPGATDSARLREPQSGSAAGESLEEPDEPQPPA